MTIKEKVKSEIDKMPQDLLEEVYKYISNLKTSKLRRGALHTFKLKGKFDNLNIRAKAYE